MLVKVCSFALYILYMRLHLYICIVVFGSFREEGDSNSVMDLSHINQDKILPEVSLLVNRDDDQPGQPGQA